GYVHLRNRRTVDAARLPQAIPPLELPEPMLHPGVEGIAEILTSVRRPEIALDNQATADVGHPLVVFARPHHRTLRYLMPPTLRHDVLVARDRIVHLPQHHLAAPGRCVRPEVVRLDWNRRFAARRAASASFDLGIEDAFPPPGFRGLRIDRRCAQPQEACARTQQEATACNRAVETRPMTFGSRFPHRQTRLFRCS